MNNLSDRFRVTGWLLCLVLVLQMAALAQQAGNAPKAQLKTADAYRLALSGRKLSSAEAEKLEKALAADPTDLAARLSLIAYYSNRYDEAFNLKKSEHALWVIRNSPDSRALREFVYLRLTRLDKGFEEAKQLWLKNVDRYKDNLVVLGNAAAFFMLADQDVAEQLIKQGAAADAGNPQWPSLLGHLYMLQMNNATAAARRTLAAKALPQFELAYKLPSNEMGKRMLLPQLTTSAFEAGEIEKARLWAVESLNQQSSSNLDPSFADSDHHAHIILGRIALRRENLAEARQQLIAAGKSPGSPVLGSFGPNMMLAKELLERGERDTVIHYFQECASFWKLHGDKLVDWTATVKSGGIPNFGANLVY